MAGIWQRMTKTDPRRNVSLRFLGIAVALGFSGGLLISDYLSWQRGREWQLTPFEITESKTLCQMQYKSGKDWRDGDLVECDASDAFIAARPDERWRATPRQYHRLALGPEREVPDMLVPELKISDEPLGPNDAGSVLVAPQFNPASPDPSLIDRPRSPRDMWLSISIYGGSLLFFALMEWLHRRRR